MKKKSNLIQNVRFVFIAGILSSVVFSCKKDEVIPTTSSIEVIDFENQFVNSTGYNDSIGESNQFEINNFVFQSIYNTDYDYFSKGFAISSLKDTVTEGYSNMYSTYAGIGGANSTIFLLATDNAKITCPTSKSLVSVDITNSTYAGLSMKNGDSFAKQFGQGDYFKLTIDGYKSGVVKDSVVFYLADFRSSNTSEHYIQKNWKTVDVTKLSNSDSIIFRLTSSDVGSWGMNTPAFFTLDNLKFN